MVAMGIYPSKVAAIAGRGAFTAQLTPLTAFVNALVVLDAPRRRFRQSPDYDGGDCCECTCDSTIQYGCDLFFDPVDCVDPGAPCVNNFVEAGTRTTVAVSANAYDTRPGHENNSLGCLDNGCAPVLTRDGITDDIESMWSCSQSIVPDGEFCKIEFTFASPLDVVDIQVAFPYEADSRRRLEVSSLDLAVR